MVEAIYFLKPAWCGIHLAGLWPEIGLTARYRSHRLPGGGLSLPYEGADHHGAGLRRFDLRSEQGAELVGQGKLKLSRRQAIGMLAAVPWRTVAAASAPS